MLRLRSLAVVVACLAALSTAASSAVIVGFDVNSATPTQMFHFQQTLSPATLTAESTLDFTVSVDGTTHTFANARFALYSELEAVAEIRLGNTTVGGVAYFTGGFTFTDSQQSLIVSGTFINAHMPLLYGSGAIGLGSTGPLSASSNESTGPVGTTMDYTAGPALQAWVETLGLYPAGTLISLEPVEDMTFTLTNLVTEGDAGFSANSSFSGNAQYLPEPATMVLLAAGAAALLRRKKSA
jgi:hypothetical protein